MGQKKGKNRKAAERLGGRGRGEGTLTVFVMESGLPQFGVGG